MHILDAHTGRRLIQEQEARLERQGECELERPLLPVRKSPRGTIDDLRQPDLVQEETRRRLEAAEHRAVAPEPVSERGARLKRERHVLDDAQLLEQAGDLERARDASLSDLIGPPPG